MAWYDNYLNKALDRLGVIRRSELNDFMPPSTIFAGETWPGAEYNVYARWSDYELQKLAVTNPWVYSSVNMIGREIAMGVIGVERRSSKQGEKWIAEIDHPFERLVEGKPNPYMGQFFTWWYQVMWLCTQGEAYWMNVPDRTGELRQLYPLPANRIVPVPDPTGDRLFSAFAYSPVTGRKPEMLSAEQVCYHRFPNIFDYHRGMSPISAYLISLQLDTEARRFDLEDFQNGLTLKHLVSMRPETSERDRLAAQADLKAGRLAGDRYMVIRAGQIDVKALETRRGENGAIRQLTREECNYIFGIPDSIREANATEASATVGWNTFKGSTIWPLMCMLDEDLTAQIVHRFYGEELRAKFEDIRPQNIELKLKEKDSKRKTQTLNEARASDGLEPHPDPEVGNAPYTIAPQVYLEKVRQATLRQETLRQAQGAPLRQAQGAPLRQAQGAPLRQAQGKAVKANGDGPEPDERDVPEEVKEYEAELGRLIERATNGEIDRTQFEELVSELTEAVLLAVFLLGTGKEEGQLTQEDKEALDERIATDLASVANLADDVYAGKFRPMDEGGAGWSVGGRVALWTGFTLNTYQVGKLFGPSERLLRWGLGAAEHCESCLDLDGQIKTAGEWRELGLYPGCDKLICSWHCHCGFTEVAQKAVYEPVISGNGQVH